MRNGRTQNEEKQPANRAGFCRALKTKNGALWTGTTRIPPRL